VIFAWIILSVIEQPQGFVPLNVKQLITEKINKKLMERD